MTQHEHELGTLDDPNVGYSHLRLNNVGRGRQYDCFVVEMRYVDNERTYVSVFQGSREELREHLLRSGLAEGVATFRVATAYFNSGNGGGDRWHVPTYHVPESPPSTEYITFHPSQDDA